MAFPIRIGLQIQPQHAGYDAVRRTVDAAEALGVDILFDWDQSCIQRYQARAGSCRRTCVVPGPKWAIWEQDDRHGGRDLGRRLATSRL